MNFKSETSVDIILLIKRNITQFLIQTFTALYETSSLELLGLWASGDVEADDSIDGDHGWEDVITQLFVSPQLLEARLFH